MRKGPAILLFLGIFAVVTPLTTVGLFWLQRGLAELGEPPPPDYVAEVEPVLKQFCYDCHSEGVNKGGFALDEHINLTLLKSDRIHWTRVMENLENGTMPPAGKPRPSPGQIATLERWIDLVVFDHDCGDPDPDRRSRGQTPPGRSTAPRSRSGPETDAVCRRAAWCRSPDSPSRASSGCDRS